jgi:hypothetical protein
MRNRDERTAVNSYKKILKFAFERFERLVNQVLPLAVVN